MQSTLNTTRLQSASQAVRAPDKETGAAPATAAAQVTSHAQDDEPRAAQTHWYDTMGGIGGL